MLRLLYQAITYFLKPQPLNKGEVTQPAPLKVQEQHLREELAKVELEQARIKNQTSYEVDK